MKKLLLTMLLLVGSFYSYAQNWQEVVYLKNGSVIRGFVVELQPGASLKIQTVDGNLFVFQMSEVEKFTRELPMQNTVGNSLYGIENVIDPIVKPESVKTRGYKGFVDGGFTAGYDFVWEVANTSHGYQFNPYFFVGGGLGWHCFFIDGSVNVPIFANVRANFLNKKCSPFVDYKIGASLGDLLGFYTSLIAGCKIKRFNIGMGFTLGTAEMYDYSSSYGGYYYNDVIGGFTFRAGFEF